MNDWYANGDKPGKPKIDPLEHSGTAIVREANEDRAELLDELFSVLPSASSADKALIRQNFATPEASRSQAHSPLLQKKVASRLHVFDDAPTLTENVRRILR